MARTLHQEIVKDVGGTLTHDAVEGRASAATCTLRKPDTSTLATPTVTIDAVNTTLNGAASAGDTTVTLTSASGAAVGRSYLLTSLGRSEWFRVRAINGAVLTLMDPLAYAHADSSPVVGTRMTFPVTAGNAATLGEGYEYHLTYTVDSVQRVVVEQWDVVRQVWPEAIVAAWEFRRMAGELGEALMEATARTGEDFAVEIANATEDVRGDLLSRYRVKPSRLRAWAAFKPAVVWRVLLNWANLGENVPGLYQETPERWQEHAQGEYDRRLQQALNVARAYDTDETGSVSDAERRRTVGVARLVR